MRAFILNTILFFSFILLLFIIVELLVPQKWITYRNWEAAKVKHEELFIGRFYPNYTNLRQEYGDLAHHTDFAVQKTRIEWVIDAIGFRNYAYVKNPNVIFIGSSNIAGSSMSQENTISSQVEKSTGLKCYNIAPSDFNQFIKLLQEEIIEKPQVLVYGSIERLIPDFNKINEGKYSKSYFNQKPQMSVAYSQTATLIDRLSKKNFKNFVKARINEASGIGHMSLIDPNMFFLEGIDAIVADEQSIVDEHVRIIKSYDTYCKELGITFIFMPIPNKETIYFDLVPFLTQPTYLANLIAKLKEEGVETVNSLSLFNNMKNRKLLYHLDDSHWNENGVDLMTLEISNLLLNDKNLTYPSN